MKLKIEAGQLLTPYAIPWSPDGWVIPNGWTPDRTLEMQVRFETLKVEHPEAPAFVLWERVETDEGERLQLKCKPWPGWVMLFEPNDPRATKTDRRISRAYLRLHGELGEWPPDGDYVFRGGKMERVRDKIEELDLCGCGKPADVLGICYDCAFDEGHYEAYGCIE